MSKKRTLKRSAARTAQTQMMSPPPRTAFSILISYDPQRPAYALINVTPVGGVESGAQIDDVVTAMRLCYEQVVLEKGALLFQQAQANAAPPSAPA